MTFTLALSLVLATPTFPAKLAALSSGPVASCGVCHQGGVTGRGTVTTPLGAALRQRGLVANDEASLESAWAGLAAVDSDGDSAADTDELASGTDPNAAGTDLVPSYGCRTAPGSPGLLLIVAAWYRRLRRRCVRKG